MVINAEAFRKLDSILKKYFKNFYCTVTRKDNSSTQIISLEKILEQPSEGRKKISSLQINMDKKKTSKKSDYGTISFHSSDSYKSSYFQYNYYFENEKTAEAFEKELQEFAQNCFHSKFSFILENVICYLVSTALSIATTYILWMLIKQVVSALMTSEAYATYASKKHRRSIFSAILIAWPIFCIWGLPHFYFKHRICSGIDFKWSNKH